MTQSEKTVLSWITGLIAVVLIVVAINSSSQPAPSGPWQNVPAKPIPPPAFQPIKPKLTKLEVGDEDPHFCKKPDDAYYAKFGRAIPMPAGSGEFHNPQFLFDAKHRDNTVSWAGDFKGTVIVCFVVNVDGEPETVTFPQSPGPDIETHLEDELSSVRFKPGWYNENYRDREPHIVPTLMAWKVTFP